VKFSNVKKVRRKFKCEMKYVFTCESGRGLVQTMTDLKSLRDMDNVRCENE